MLSSKSFACVAIFMMSAPLDFIFFANAFSAVVEGVSLKL